MSTVLEIEEAVAKLPERDFQTFAAWFDQIRASRVGGSFESDILGGQFGETAPFCPHNETPSVRHSLN